jgi:DNA-binding transcriptional ArsR family regulator
MFGMVRRRYTLTPNCPGGPVTTTVNCDPIPLDALERAAGVIKCLGHPLRLRLLDVMERVGEASVSELQLFSGATQVAVSEQLGILRGRNVVAARRDGPFMQYRITEPRVAHILACVRECDEPEQRPRKGRERSA